MAQKPLSVLISGAGVAGSSLALMLARSPAFKVKPRITLIERSEVARKTGQAIDIRGPAVDVIRRLGLEPTIKAKHTSETGIAFVNGTGKILGQFNATGDPAKQGVTSEYEILRADLVGLLIDGVNDEAEKHGGAEVNVVYGERIASLENQTNGVDVKFLNGKMQNQRFDVVVAADGVSSKTRPIIFGEQHDAEHIKPSGMYIAWFTIPRIPEDDSIYRWCSIPGGLSIHLRPHGNQKTMGCYFTIINSKRACLPELETVLGQDVAAQKVYMRKQFQNIEWQNERFLAGLDAADDFYMSHWCRVITPQWAEGRCALVGDAAFATMGVGTSLAMTGAYMIAGELSQMASSADVPAALRRYETAFRPYVMQHEKVPPGIPQITAPQSALGVGVLYTAIRLVFGLRLPQVLMKVFGGEEKEGWRLPEYGWEETEPATKKASDTVQG